MGGETQSAGCSSGHSQPTPTLLLRALGITGMSARVTLPSQGRSQSSTGIKRWDTSGINLLNSAAIPSEAWPEERQKTTMEYWRKHSSTEVGIYHGYPYFARVLIPVKVSYGSFNPRIMPFLIRCHRNQISIDHRCGRGVCAP